MILFKDVHQLPSYGHFETKLEKNLLLSQAYLQFRLLKF